MIEIRRSALVRFQPGQMFDLVNDVEAYPTRFNWCASAAVQSRDDVSLTASLGLRFAGITSSFTTRNTFDRPGRIELEFVDGPFRSLHGEWTFTALGDPDSNESGCKVALDLDFEFSNRLAAPALRIGFQNVADRMVDDFCRVARSVYAKVQ